MFTNWNSELTQLFAWIGAFGLTGSVATAGAFLLFRFLGRSWVETKVQERLVSFKAEKDRELERLRAEIGRLLDRAARFNNKEYEVLPEAWKLLTMAYGLTAHIVSNLRSRPDLDQMSTPELTEFLDQSDLKEWQKAELHQKRDKTRYYSQHCSWKELRQAENALSEYYNYVLLNDIFIETSFSEIMAKIALELRMATYFVRCTLDETGAAGGWNTAKTHQAAAEKLVEELRKSIRTRIYDFMISPG